MGSGADRPSAVARRTTREWWKEAGEGQRNEAPPSCPRTTSMSGQGVASKAWRGDGLSQPRGEGTFP
jgi:hypothetical protein